jgi:hypothetical protein
MGVLPSEMASMTKLQMNIFDGIDEEDEDADTRFGVVQPKPKIEVKPDIRPVTANTTVTQKL